MSSPRCGDKTAASPPRGPTELIPVALLFFWDDDSCSRSLTSLSMECGLRALGIRLFGYILGLHILTGFYSGNGLAFPSSPVYVLFS
ncbi:hypothetical protein STEG23_003953 [Scotinomys teguina]